MIGAVENGILDRVKAASVAEVIAYSYATMETWPKEFDSYLSSEVVRYPACWSVYGGSHEIEQVARGRWRAHSTFALVVAAENKRNEQSRRHGGSASEPGSYQMAQDAVRILGSHTLGLDIDALEPVSIQPVETSDIPKLKQMSLYAVTFKTGLYYQTAACSDLADFNTFHANWDPAPFGHVDADPTTPGVQIPDDAHAIGTDNIALNQGDFMTTDTRHVKPSEGRRVRHPGTGRLLPEDGEPVAWGSYWQRKLQAKDVELVAAKPGKGKGDESKEG